MRNIIKVDDIRSFPELELYKGNKEVHLLRYYEPEPGIFIAESRNVIDIALKKGYQPLSLVLLERLAEDPILDRVGDVPIYVVTEDQVRQNFGYSLPGGIICAMRRKPAANYAEVLWDARRILVLEDVENPTNVGAMFRTAAALGIDAVLLSPACCDPFYRRSMRVSVGNVFLIPWSYACRSESEWKAQGIEMLKTEGFRTCALALREDNVNIDDPVLKAEDKLAIIMGNEGNGLSSSTISACDYVAKIPMMEGVDSLNVGVAAGIAMWELGNR